MFYYDRLNDDYEIHQRNYCYLKDDLDVLVSDSKVKRPSLFRNAMSRIGDVLISTGNSMKEQNEIRSTNLSSFNEAKI